MKKKKRKMRSLVCHLIMVAFVVFTANPVLAIDQPDNDYRVW